MGSISINLAVVKCEQEVHHDFNDEQVENMSLTNRLNFLMSRKDSSLNIHMRYSSLKKTKPSSSVSNSSFVESAEPSRIKCARKIKKTYGTVLHVCVRPTYGTVLHHMFVHVMCLMHLPFLPLTIKLNLFLDKVKRVEYHNNNKYVWILSMCHTHEHTLLLVLQTQRLRAKRGIKKIIRK